MSRVVGLLLLAACGRIGFDGAAGTAPSDATPPDGGFFGSPRCSTGVVLCEDFEAPMLDTTRWSVAIATGTIAVDATRAARGSQSLHASGPANQSVQVQAQHFEQTALPDPLFVRIFVYAPSLPSGSSDVMVWLGPTTLSQGLQLETDFIGNMTYDGWSLGDAAFNSSTALSTDRWVCLEWEITTGSPGTMSLWIDDAPVAELQGIARNTPPQLFGVLLGIAHNPSADGLDLWLDELVVDRARIGCSR